LVPKREVRRIVGGVAKLDDRRVDCDPPGFFIPSPRICSLAHLGLVCPMGSYQSAARSVKRISDVVAADQELQGRRALSE
jgi:hypothetical protein